MLGRVYAPEERLLGVAGQDRDRILKDDRPRIERTVHKMDRDAGDLDSGLESIPDGVGARERRQ